jgi:hypothetical protein
MCDTDKTINTESLNKDKQIKTPKEIEKELKKLNRYKVESEKAFFYSLKNTKRLADLIKEHGGVISYTPNKGISIDKTSYEKMPEPIQTQFKYGLGKLEKYFSILYEADCQARAFNAYLYLLEMQYQKHRILNSPIKYAKVTLAEWRNCLLKEVALDSKHVDQIERHLIESDKLIYCWKRGTKCLTSSMEKNGEKLNLKEDYRISFNEWMNTNRIVYLEMDRLKLAFPCR